MDADDIIQALEHSMAQVDAFKHAEELWAIEGHELTVATGFEFAHWAEENGLINHETADNLRRFVVKETTEIAENIREEERTMEAEAKHPRWTLLKKRLTKLSYEWRQR